MSTITCRRVDFSHQLQILDTVIKLLFQVPTCRTTHFYQLQFSSAVSGSHLWMLRLTVVPFSPDSRHLAGYMYATFCPLCFSRHSRPSRYPGSRSPVMPPPPCPPILGTLDAYPIFDGGRLKPLDRIIIYSTFIAAWLCKVI